MEEESDTRKINNSFLRDHNYATEGIFFFFFFKLLRLMAAMGNKRENEAAAGGSLTLL